MHEPLRQSPTAPDRDVPQRNCLRLQLSVGFFKQLIWLSKNGMRVNYQKVAVHACIRKIPIPWFQRCRRTTAFELSRSRPSVKYLIGSGHATGTSNDDQTFLPRSWASRANRTQSNTLVCMPCLLYGANKQVCASGRLWEADWHLKGQMFRLSNTGV